MWGQKNEMPFSNNHTVIAKGTKVVGDVHFDGELHVEGKVCGNIVAESSGNAKVTVSEKGLVEGEIKVPTIVINGTVSGDVYSGKHIELAAKATVQGNVHYHLIEMVKGAQVNGSLVYSGDEVKSGGSVGEKAKVGEKPKSVTPPGHPAGLTSSGKGGI